jgi:3'-5' exoribonuclease
MLNSSTNESHENSYNITHLDDSSSPITQKNQSLLIKTIAQSINDGYLSGLYRITGVIVKIAKNGEPYVSIRLSDSTGDVHAVLWPERKSLNWNPPYRDSMNSCVYASGAVNYFSTSTNTNPANKKPIIVVNEIRLATEKELDEAPALTTLPRLYCPNKDVFNKLINTARSLENPPLKRFVCRVLNQGQVFQTFLQAPASTKYHHSYPGGLVEHSVEVACIINNIELYRSPTEKELAIVGGLLHDVGKVRSYNSFGNMSLNGKLTDHNAQTLEICADALKELDSDNYKLAEALRHIWTCSSPGSRYGRPSKFAIAHVVSTADRISAEFGNENAAFASAPTNQNLAKLGQLEYCRLA